MCARNESIRRQTTSVLTPQQLTLHLLSRGLISPGDVVDNDFRIVGRSRNNHNFEITLSRRRSYFTKEPRKANAALDVEAAFYRVIGNGSRAKSLRRYLPSFCDYSRDRRLLVLRLIKNAATISDALTSGGRVGERIASALGKAVGTIHTCDLGDQFQQLADIPWVVSLPAPDIQLLREISTANLQLVRIVQQSKSLCRCLEQLRQEWQPLSLIHGDLRFANCIVRKHRRRGFKEELKIADWELSGLGEPSWDVGCVFAGFLTSWVWSMPFLGGSTLARPLRPARLPLSRLRPAMQSFWTAYASARKFRKPEVQEFLLRAVRFTAARLIQSAYERMQQSASMTGNNVVLLQVSANIAARPRQAASNLFGIEVAR